MEKMIKEMYEEFRGIPSTREIVRNGILNDAFELVVLKLLYGEQFRLRFEKQYVDEIARYIIAPPDSGIDIFVEEENGDVSRFDVIQVKYSELNEIDIQSAFAYMKKTIKDYCKNPKNVKSENCRETLRKSSLDKNNKKNCHYYVVHKGKIHGSITENSDETVLNLVDLQIIKQSKKNKVQEETFVVEGLNGVMQFGDEKAKQNAIVCSLNCYDLACLNTKYYSTVTGRNILFGHNLREALGEKTKDTKSYKSGIMETIEKEPENFWYYNNGITIVAEEVIPEKKEENFEIKICQFSIVNGAQTTSTLGKILRDAERDGEDDIIAALKKAYVVARVLKVESEKTQHSISRYNNTQNPINSRDMVANNTEQEILHNKFLDENYPQIYMEIRRGSTLPQTFNKIYTHRITTNEALAQMVYAGFFMKPFTAKDKKASIFNNDYTQKKYTLNEVYHAVFHYDAENNDICGILHKKEKYEVDELLFVQQLYKDCKIFLKKKLQERIDNLEEKKENALPDEISSIVNKVNGYSRKIETMGVCMVYFVTAYYDLCMEFGGAYQKKRFDYEKYYSDKKYKMTFIEEAANFFLMKTVDILIATADTNNKGANINNWVRSQTCEAEFLRKLDDLISSDFSIENNFTAFMNKYKIIPV